MGNHAVGNVVGPQAATALCTRHSGEPALVIPKKPPLQAFGFSGGRIHLAEWILDGAIRAGEGGCAIPGSPRPS